MKIKFTREERDGFKVVKLYCGGGFVSQIGEDDMKIIDWKNASEAKHACREELQKWLDETPPKPEQLTTKDAWDLNCVDFIAAVEKRTREIVAWEQEHEKRTREIVAWEQEHGDDD